MSGGLREKVMKGGLFLILRQGIGLIIGLGGMILLTRIIGPNHYGIYTASLGILIYLLSIAGLGLNVFLIRKEQDVEKKDFDQVFTLLLITSAIALLIGILLAPIYSQWVQSTELLKPFLILILTLPITALSYPALARLERDLNYKAIAILELSGQFIYYGFALTLAWMGYGVWAPVIGYWVQQVYLSIAALFLARYVPKLTWSNKRVKEMIAYGFSYSSSLWVWQLRNLVNPLLVGRFLGVEGVAIVALAIRIVEALSFVKNATWRLSIATMAKLQGDVSRLKKALEEAMVLQILALGPLLVLFAVVSIWVVPLFFGEEWSQMVIIFPFIALSYLINAVFNMHSSVLYVLKRNNDVTLFHVVHVLLFGGGAYLLVPILGITGYGWAEVIAILSYFAIHQKLKKILEPSYAQIRPLLVGFVPVLFIPFIQAYWAYGLLVFLLVIFFHADTRSMLKGYLNYVKRKKTSVNLGEKA